MATSPLQSALVRRLRPVVVDRQFAALALSCQATSSRIPLTLLHQPSLDGFAANEAPGTMTVLREGSVDGPIMGVGFYDPNSVAVEVFEWSQRLSSSSSGSVPPSAVDEITAAITASHILSGDAGEQSVDPSSPALSPTSQMPPIPDVRYFHGRLMAAFRRRSTNVSSRGGGGGGAMVSGATNARRLFNGAADGIPSVYIDQYGSIAHVYFTTHSAAQLLPLIEILLLKVLELRRVYNFSPEKVQFGVKESILKSSATLENSFSEHGLQYYAPSEQLNPNIRTIHDVIRSTFNYAFHPLQHAEARRWLARHSQGRSVVLLGDEVASMGAALNAVTAAEKVYYSYEHDRTLRRFRSQFDANFNQTIFNARVECLRSGELSFPLAKEVGASIVALSGVAIGGALLQDAAFACDFLLEGANYANREDGRVGYLMLMCGSNSLGLPRLTSAGLIPSAEETIAKVLGHLGQHLGGGAAAAAADGTSVAPPSTPVNHASRRLGSRSVAIKEVARFNGSRAFPHNQSIAAGGLVEGWAPGYCDVVLEVRIVDKKGGAQ